MTLRDWDDAFANMAHVENSHALPDFWANRAAAWREALPQGGITRDIAYGEGPRRMLDIIRPEGTPKGLAVFVHGGYWMRLEKSHWSDLAKGAQAQGWAVCIPSYTLAPQARITEMTAEIGAAITVAAGLVEGPICLAGHSAGGHLVTRMLCADSPLDTGVRARIRHTLSISGLHDLRPLLHTAMNDILHLDPDEARAESAVLQRPFGTSPLTCWVGGGERPEFIRQAHLMDLMWQGLDVPTRLHIDGMHNHFTILDGLKDPDAPITRAFIGKSPQTGDKI
jgi:acetyl esterase/lipase